MLLRNPWRVSIPMIVMSLLLLAGGVATGWYIHSTQHEASNLVMRTVDAAETSIRLSIDLREIRTRLRHFIDTSDPAELEAVYELNRRVRESLAAATRSSQTADEVKTLQQIKAAYDDFDSELRRHQSNADISDADALFLIKQKMTPGLIPEVERYREAQQLLAQETVRLNQSTADRVGLGLTLLGLFGSAAGLVGGYWIARGLSRSLVRLTLPMHDTVGRLNEIVGPIELTATDDVGDLETLLLRVSEQVAAVIAKLEQSQRDALRAEQLAAVGQLAAGVAHELRNPLMAMKLLVQTALEDGDQGRLAGRDLSVLDEEIRRQEQTIHMFLDFARPLKLEPRDVNLCDVVATVLELAARRADRHHVQIGIGELPQPAMIRGDASQIRQVLLNLVFNAIDSIKMDGSIEISLTRDMLRPFFELRVADSGPGLASDIGDRIFEAFVSTKDAGLGLGLSISKRIIEAHGGSVSARNRTDTRGAEFLVRLPENCS